MIHPSLSSFMSTGIRQLGKGPYAIVLLDDLVEVASTLRHALALGFRGVLAVGTPDLDLPEDLQPLIHHIHHDLSTDGAMEQVVNALIDAKPGEWIHYCYNAEYFYFPFCETRNVRELIAFSQEERRDSVLSFVVDLYAGDLAAHPDAVDRDDAYLDMAGYYALSRKDPADGRVSKDRQLDFYGGLRWRYEEHIPFARRRIDRVALFRAAPGVHLRADHTFSDEEYNTYACPWHHNITAALCSFRTAKALKTNAGSTFAIDSFRWRNSVPFAWQSNQLMELGLMEPGQWF